MIQYLTREELLARREGLLSRLPNLDALDLATCCESCAVADVLSWFGPDAASDYSRLLALDWLLGDDE